MLRILGITCALALAVVPAGRARADDEADTRAVIDKAIKAHGGAESLEKYRGVRMKFKGKRDAQAETVTFTGNSAFQLPDRLRIDLDTTIKGKRHRIVQVLNGEDGWVSLDGRTDRMDRQMLAQIREQLYTDEVTRLTPLSGKAFKLVPLGEQKVAGRAAVGVRVEHKDRRPISLFFDKANGLLLLSETRVRSETRAAALGEKNSEVDQETYYEDYRKVNGVQVAHKTRVRRDGKPFLEAEATEVKVSEKLPDSTFEKP